MKTLNINSFAQWVVYHFLLNGIPITPLKLQKLLYYCQSWHLVYFEGNPLFDEQPKAWSNGPVYTSVYHSYKDDFLRHQLIEASKEVDIEKEYHSLGASFPLSDDQKELIREVLNKYGSYTSAQLVFLTHSEKPWNEAREGCDPFGPCKIPISFDTMRTYYGSRLKK